MENASTRAFAAASRFYADAVAAVPPERYAERWSDVWRIIDLIAHGNRANTLPVEYYERPVAKAGPEYVLPESIAARAREAVSFLGEDPVATVRAASERALAVVAAAPEGATVGTPFGEELLETYLASRTAELMLHGLDLDADLDPPDEAVTAATAFLCGRAVRLGRGIELLRALSGRGALAPGFSVY
ncbi:MAG: maleylpyruvate isomerase N-terminal domain-containing protein [Actinomycetota bacterium]|nr:maleylpyruvate isomerase N-terminal domain-containing protein [Actinomycetota bacterium]